MASLKFAVLIILILAFYYQPIARGCPSCPEECCFSLREGKPLAVRTIQAYRRTAKNCRLNAVVLSMKSGRELCVRDQDTWVQRVMKMVPEKRK
ncbi:C-C motif chemokine 16-like [Candoia aspera]|uniref:C-C motif chemokine 16-like n=1 Tax=Candoia aspera TaxID=51853 RepID=UPI002FD862A3